MSTEATLIHHLQSLKQGVDAILSDYAHDSVLFTPDGPIRGLDGIGAFFEGFLNSSPPELLDSVHVGAPGYRRRYRIHHLESRAFYTLRHRYLCHPFRQNPQSDLCHVAAAGCYRIKTNNAPYRPERKRFFRLPITLSTPKQWRVPTVKSLFFYSGFQPSWRKQRIDGQHFFIA